MPTKPIIPTKPIKYRTIQLTTRTSPRLGRRVAFATLATAMTAAVLAVVAEPATAAVPGLTVVTASSATDSRDHKSARAECPAGTVAIGSGATIEGGLGQVNIESVVPSSTSVSAGGYEDANGTNNLWSVTAQAVCADPPPGHVLVYATSVQDSSDKSVTAVCPGNTVTIGSGALLAGSYGDVELEAVRPEADQVTVTGNEIGAGTTTPWFVVAYASCADPLPGLVTVTATSAHNASNKNVVATCPAGTRVLTAGGRLHDGNGRVLLDDLFVDTTTVTATGKETGNGTGIPWRVKAIATCATP